MVSVLAFHGYSLTLPTILAVTVIGSCESVVLSCTLKACPDELGSVIVLPRIVVGLSDHDLFETSFMETMSFIKTANLVALDELLVANLAVMTAFDLRHGRANLIVRYI